MKNTKKTENPGMPCPDCEQGTLELVLERFETVNEEKKAITVPDVEMEVCTRCGEQFLTPKGSALVSDYLAAAAGSLTVEELESFLRKYDLTHKKAAQILGIGEKNFSRWISGRQRVSRSMSNYIRTLMTHPPAFETLKNQDWRGAASENLEHRQPDKDERPILTETDTSKLIEMGLIPNTRKRDELCSHVCGLAGVENLIQFRDWCAEPAEKIAAYKDTRQKYSAINGGLWIRLGERAAHNIQVSPYRRDKLEEAVEDLRQFTEHEPHAVFSDLQARLARAGVALVVIPLLKGSAFRGCTRLLNPAKAMIVHSLKYKNSSEFWRVLFHEIAHLILHINSPEDCFEEYADQTEDPIEAEATQWADELLVYGEKLVAFHARHKEPTLHDLRVFAADLKTSPAIVADIINKSAGWNVYHYGKLRNAGLFPGISPEDAESMWQVSKEYILHTTS